MDRIFKIYKMILIGIVAYFVFEYFFAYSQTLSATGINIIATILVIAIGGPLSIAGVMANDSGQDKPEILFIQFLTLSYPLSYLIGLISSIVVLYGDHENKKELAKWLASISLIHLGIIILGIGFLLLKEKLFKR